MFDYQQMISIGFVVILISVGSYFLYRNLRKYYSKHNYARLIKKISKYSLRNVIVPDAVEGTSIIDWVILTPQGILVLCIKNYRGMIFASDNIHQWTQVVARRSFKFDNPLQQLELDVVTIKTLAPGVNVKGFVVFDYDSHFPKGRPKNVTTIAEIKQSIKALQKDEISPELLAQWNKLTPMLKQEPEVQSHYAAATHASR